MPVGLEATSSPPEEWITGGGEMGERYRAMDWSRTPLGPAANWSPTLRMMIRFLLANRFPHLLLWGPDLCQLYNDPYRPVLGDKHPRFIGQPARECWAEIWHIIGPLLETPYHGGPPTWMEDIALEINRHGFVEETHFTIAYSPVPDDTVASGIGGVLATVHEITEKVVGERRVAALRDFGVGSLEVKTDEEACAVAAETMEKHALDFPFALLYLIEPDGSRARLACAAGLEPGETASPLTLALGGDEGVPACWPLAEVVRSETIQVVDDLSGRLGDAVPPGPWADPPTQAVVVPIRSHSAHRFAGLLVAGVSSRLRFDDAYRNFIELAAGQIGTAIANARAFEEEKRRAEALAEIDRAKTAFFSNVSHEFRTPLTLMLGPLEDALEQGPAAAMERSQLEIVHRNGLRLLKLVNTLLEFSRIEAGRVQASYQATDLAELTTDLASIFRAAIERAGLELVLDCPPLAEPVHVDREMWEKIVLNLLSNAFKFTFEGRIEVHLRRVGDEMELRVRDTGIGIAPAELPHLFDRFHRVAGARGRSQEGSGIGLALVRELVHLHGGEVDVESAEGRGTTFVVTIPCEPARMPALRNDVPHPLASTATVAEAYVQEAARWLPDSSEAAADFGTSGASHESAPHDAGESRESSPPARRARILIADDNADLREYLARLLAPLHEVEVVADGEAALAALREHRPDMVLTDVMMPRLDGFGLLKAVRDDPGLAQIPVMLLSARAGEESRIEGLQAGADDYMVKPFSARELIARVGARLEIARLREDTQAAVRQRTAQFETLLNEAPLGVYLVDGDFRICEMNPTAQQAFGDIPGLAGGDFDAVIHGVWPREHADEIVRRFRHTLATGESYFAPELIEERLDRGVTEYYEWQVNRVPLPDGRQGVVCYFRDVSQSVLAREALRESEARLRTLAESLESKVTERTAELQESNDQLVSFSYSASHDLRAPVRAIRGYLDALMEDLAGVERPGVGHYGRQIADATERMDRLIQDLLDYSRLAKVEIPKEPTRFADVVKEALLQVESETVARHAQITAAIPEDLPNVLAHPRTLVQAVVNLVGNALKFVAPGIVPHVQIRGETRGDRVRLWVEDNGIGIAPEHQERIFRVFEQLHSRNKYMGTGVGLAMVKKAVERMDGDVDLESTVGTGSRFWIELPKA